MLNQQIELPSNPNIKRILQVSEEAQPPVQVAFVYNNECYVMTQQDVRKIEDVRSLSYSKLKPNGELMPIHDCGNSNVVNNPFVNAYRHTMNQMQPRLPMHIVHNESDVSFAHPFQRDCRRCNNDAYVNTMDVDSTPVVASLRQQLQWSKANENSSAPVPFTYTVGTSMSDMRSSGTRDNACQCCCCSCCCCTNRGHTKQRVCCDRSVNTSDPNLKSCQASNTDPVDGKTLTAQEQLKQKKTKTVSFN